jgi:hypothetical protein
MLQFLGVSILLKQGLSMFNTILSSCLMEHGQKTSEFTNNSLSILLMTFRVMRLVGMYYRTACEEFFPAIGALHFPQLGWEKAEMEVFFAECRQSMRDPNIHAYGKMHFWSGQKPLDG